MISKIVKGGDFKGAVNYILDKRKEAKLIHSEGVFTESNETIIKSFEAQAQLNPKVSKCVGHISLSFSKEDLPKLSDELMVQISREYLKKMGITNTQFIIGRHFDKEHPHLHIAFNRIDNNGKTISDKHDVERSIRICQEITRQYGLYFAKGNIPPVPL